MLGGMLFDLDGTLVDSNDLHVRAWHAAMQKHGFHVAPDRIAVEVGKGGDQLVPDLLGRGAEHEAGDALRRTHGEEFTQLAEREGIRAMPGAQDLLRALRKRGFALALATSSKADQLGLVERTSGVAWRELVDVTTTADDAERSKPAPDILQAALEKLALGPAECAMFGDTPWDAHAAKGAGVTLIGVTCGGNEPRALLRAGAREVMRDPAAVLAELDAVLHRASPSRIRLDRARLEALMARALDAADAALADGEAPIGCAIADGDGAVIATGYNRLNRTGDRAAHAEIDALRAAGARLPAREAILVSTLEPCVMCLGAAMEVAIDTVVYALRADDDCGTSRVTPPQSADNQMPRIVGDIAAAESRARFERWLARPDRNRDQEPFIRGVLAHQRAR
ncbi:MAG TPA: HAD-IA family hydrolase [Kofleriaceae bacterium]|nr:HAD-IA family hydrolase [Kofleriaceae bacterium]